jgi:uroporphyrinogen-III synthase
LTDAGQDWSTVPFYAVGQATAAALKDITTVAGTSLLAPRDIRGGSETGTSEKLAHFILHDLAPLAPNSKLLYLTGDKNRDVLPSMLQNGGMQLRSLQVYKTQGATSFPNDLQNAVHSVPGRKIFFALLTSLIVTTRSLPQDPRSWWIVYFAPSAADFVTPILREHLSIPGSDSDKFSVKIAAIGSTTSAFLREELHVRVDAVPPKPSPDALVGSIRDFDASLSPI